LCHIVHHQRERFAEVRREPLADPAAGEGGDLQIPTELAGQFGRVVDVGQRVRPVRVEEPALHAEVKATVSLLVSDLDSQG
jgi:hypothetical protein